MPGGGNGGGADDDAVLVDAVAGGAGGGDTKRVPGDPVVTSLADLKWTTEEVMTSTLVVALQVLEVASCEGCRTRLYCQGPQPEQASRFHAEPPETVCTDCHLSSSYALEPCHRARARGKQQ